MLKQPRQLADACYTLKAVVGELVRMLIFPRHVERHVHRRGTDRKAEGARILAEAKEKQNAILKEAFAEKEQIIDEAHRKAAAETRLQVEEAARRIREEKEKAIREVRSEIADLSIAIAEKVMKEKISRDKEQQQIIDRLLDEVSFCKS